MSRRATAARGARTIALAAVSATGALLLAGCAPSTTTLNYDPSDGVGVTVAGADALRGINLMVVGTAEGEPGNLLGALTNGTQDDASFTLETPDGSPVTVEVPAGDTVYLGTETGESVQIDTVSAPPGSYVDATLAAAGGSTEFKLPILDGTLPEYADSLPSAAASASPSASPTE
ncbi:hypothetical protein GCM10027063_09330 [Promicromonospora xylanilytica]